VKIKKQFLIKVAVLVTYLTMIAANALANILPIGGITTGEISNFYPNLFAPAAYTFAIWGLIYLLLAGYVLYQFGLFQKKKSKKREELLQKIAPYFIYSSIANTLWIFAWHYKLITLSVFLMIAILICLIRIANMLREKKFDLHEKIFILTPFSVYFGWITVATVANITTFLVSIRWYGFGIAEQNWTVIILVVAAIIGILRILRDQNIIYGLVFIWAYIGIFVKHVSPNEFDSEYTPVITAAPITIVMLAIANIYVYLKNKAPKKRLS
jgi:hypothetical protein